MRAIPRSLVPSTFAGIAAIVASSACTEARAPQPQGRTAVPVCPHGAFAAELEAMLPPVAPVKPVTLVPAASIEANIEPGCVLPFRSDPDERVLDVGRVVVKTVRRGTPGSKPMRVGRGRLVVGRRVLRLHVANEAGDETLSIEIDGTHVRAKERKGAAFDSDVSLDDDSSLPLPFDALVAALDRCDADKRLGKTADGNVIEARRGELALWRSRWMDQAATSVIDTSVVCTAADARLLWRTAAGEMLPMIAVASARSDRVLTITRQGPSETEDVSPYATPDSPGPQ